MHCAGAGLPAGARCSSRRAAAVQSPVPPATSQWLRRHESMGTWSMPSRPPDSARRACVQPASHPASKPQAGSRGRLLLLLAAHAHPSARARRQARLCPMKCCLQRSIQRPCAPPPQPSPPIHPSIHPSFRRPLPRIQLDDDDNAAAAALPSVELCHCRRGAGGMRAA